MYTRPTDPNVLVPCVSPIKHAIASISFLRVAYGLLSAFTRPPCGVLQPHTRCEEERTREAWAFLRLVEETSRGEELVRMRAEERFTRSLLDLELQDSRRVEIAQREAKEKARMWSEDLAVRDLKRLEKDQMVEREEMGAEDVLARTWKSIKE